jgi:segregation and condensation protein B
VSRKLIEAALFMSSRPMSAEEISKLTRVPPGDVEKTLGILSREYDGEGKGVEVVRIPEGWEMRVRPDILPKVAHLTPYSDLKDGHKRTLALVAYKEPVKQSDIVRIQGNKSYNYIKFLRKKGLIKSEKEGRTVKLSLTKEFERYFGIEKGRIKEMLQKGLERAKARDEAKAQKAVGKADERPLPGFVSKPETPSQKTIPESRSSSPGEATPPTNVQYIEVAAKKAGPKIEETPKIQARPGTKATGPGAKPADNFMKPVADAAGKTAKPPRRKSKKLPPAAKIGTRRPAG